MNSPGPDVEPPAAPGPVPGNTGAEAEEELPALPGLRNWRGVYVFVIAFFVLCVILLAAFSRAFS